MPGTKIKTVPREIASGFKSCQVGVTRVVLADCFRWLDKAGENSIHGVVTDPPYGVKEYDIDQLEKRSNGNGGIWRIPPSFDGHTRSPLPRFTALNGQERSRLCEFFVQWSKSVVKVLRPGGHVFIATNSFLAQLLYSSLTEGGLEFRGQTIRLVRTLRGGDRPKNAEREFPDVSSMARGCFEPWGIFRKPMFPGMKVSDCLREFGTGGLRRYANDKPFSDVVASERTPRREREIANHPSLKPQSLLRRLVYVSLPLGEGIVLDPFMGSGSTLAAAEAVGVNAVGVERHAEYYEMSLEAIPKLASLKLPEIDSLVGVQSEQVQLF
ncbi:MAG: site-specific DNA-methyltransferase [candidate division Zixibacteria bacterium]|nr:site-specific DNA-methyltransferase [candidate division Zixibacteria bacterium]